MPFDDYDNYVQAGERRALALDNRGPVRFTATGELDPVIAEAYWRTGFFVFEGVISAAELQDLQTEMEAVFARAPCGKDAVLDRQGRPALGLDFDRPVFRFARPLSDPVGGTSANNGRHEVKMTEPEAPADAPEEVISGIGGPLQIMDSCLRLYGHPELLAVAEALHGPDFTPFTEAIIVKPAHLGTSVAWHQDGTTHWGRADWDQGTHGFNFMAQLYGSTAANGVWVMPGSHKEGKIDIRRKVAENGGSDRLPGAIPMVCAPGDVVMANRQALHGSFANTSAERRVTYNFGFHRRSSVLDAERVIEGEAVTYDEHRVHERSRLIALAIDARRQRYPAETPYTYQPLATEIEQNRWDDMARESIVKNYVRNDLGI